MKAILEFNLPEEAEDHKLALNGSNYKYTLDEMDNYFRSRLKYEELSEEVREALEETRKHFNNLIIDLY